MHYTLVIVLVVNFSFFLLGFGSSNTGSVFGQAANTGGTVFGQASIYGFLEKQRALTCGGLGQGSLFLVYFKKIQFDVFNKMRPSLYWRYLLLW